jgi:hypothetical protein
LAPDPGAGPKPNRIYAVVALDFERLVIRRGVDVLPDWDAASE